MPRRLNLVVLQSSSVRKVLRTFPGNASIAGSITALGTRSSICRSACTTHRALGNPCSSLAHPPTAMNACAPRRMLCPRSLIFPPSQNPGASAMTFGPRLSGTFTVGRPRSLASLISTRLLRNITFSTVNALLPFKTPSTSTVHGVGATTLHLFVFTRITTPAFQDLPCGSGFINATRSTSPLALLTSRDKMVSSKTAGVCLPMTCVRF